MLKIDIKTEVDKYKNVIDNLISQALTLNTYELKMSCLFSILDSFAQESAIYTRDKKEPEKFSDFILSNQHSWPFLSKVDPVTLYYRIADKLPLTNYLDFLKEGGYYNVDNSASQNAVEKILSDAKKIGVDEERITVLRTQHQFARLLHQMRNKISHELSSPSYAPSSEEAYHNIPYYTNVTRSYYSNDIRNDDKVWELFIPVSFIRDLIKECSNSYFSTCLEENKIPFANNTFNRKCKLSWYDK